MNKKLKYLLLFPTISLVSCGFSVSNLVPGNKYNSPVFEENYYRHWDNELKNAKIVSSKNVTDESITNYNDLEQIDPNFALGGPATAEEYGALYKMNAVDDLFRYGYQSKLFDGQMVCGAQDGHMQYAYQLGRVQIDSNGFSARFSKESSELNYFALQFKATTDNTKDCYPVNSSELSPAGSRDHDTAIFHNSTLNLKVTLYTKTSKGIEGHQYTSEIAFNANTTNNGHVYKFFAFDLKEENLSRLIGCSITYEVDDELINWNKEKGISLDYALMLYEMFFPYTNWN